MKNFTISVLFLFAFSLAGLAQCSMVELPLIQKVTQSQYIVEGVVTQTESMWNATHTHINTINTIQVWKGFKGGSYPSTMKVVTQGGKVGNKMEKLDPGLVLSEGDKGLFMLIPNNISGVLYPGAPVLYRVYGDRQGWFEYLRDGIATDFFNHYNNIAGGLYPAIEQITGTPFVLVQASVSSMFSSGSFASTAAVPVISGFTPSSLSAGTYAQLTINGSGFGATQGSSVVRFKNANNGGATYSDLPVTSTVSWSDIQIIVVVETGTISPGTGTIQVDVGGTTATSSSTLTVTFHEMNILSGGLVYQTDHIDADGAGGYSWQMNNAFATNVPAVDAFKRAMQSWRCKTHIRWVLGANTAINVASNDGTNIVRFDSGAELSPGTLGVCTSYWSGCGSAPTITWYVDEMDIVFDDATSWYYLTGTPGGSQSDFESVALHELGHGHQFGHVINNSDVMHYALTTGTFQRNPSANNIAAGNDVMSRSVVVNACPGGVQAMDAFTNCTCSFVAPSFIDAGTNVTVCSADPVTLGASSITGHTYSWSPATDLTSNTISNPVATPSSTTTYTLTETDTISSCINTDVVTLTIGASFTTNAGADQTLCGVGTVNLGGPPVPLHTYSWNPPTGLGTPSASATTAGPLTTTTYTLTDVSGSCTGTDVVTVTVGVLVTADAGLDATICPGSSTTLGEASSAGMSYSWNPTTDLSSATSSTPTADPSVTTTYTVTKTETASGCFDTDVVTITVSGSFSISAGPDVTLCAGATTNLGGASTAGYTYSWLPPTGLSSNTISNPVASPTVTTSYILTQTHTASGCQAVDTVVVNIGAFATPDFNGTPVIGDAPLTVNFTDVSVGTASDWKWDVDFDGTVDYSSQNPSHTYTVPGNYSVSLEINAGCYVTTKMNYVIVHVGTGKENLSAKDGVVLIFPNPVTGKSQLKITGAASNISGNLSFKLYDITGREVRNLRFTASEAEAGVEIDRIGLADAVYFYEVSGPDGILFKGNLVVR